MGSLNLPIFGKVIGALNCIPVQKFFGLHFFRYQPLVLGEKTARTLTVFQISFTCSTYFSQGPTSSFSIVPNSSNWCSLAIPLLFEDSVLNSAFSITKPGFSFLESAKLVILIRFLASKIPTKISTFLQAYNFGKKKKKNSIVKYDKHTEKYTKQTQTQCFLLKHKWPNNQPGQ